MKRKSIRSTLAADAPAQADVGGKGLAGPAAGAQSDDNMPLPHEIDQSTGQVARQPDAIIRQASKDLEAGLVDTDLRATPGLDAARRARMVDTPQPVAGVGSRARGDAPSPNRQRRERGPR